MTNEESHDTERKSQQQPAPTDLVATKVANRYELVAKLGGFGDVYKALDAKIMSRPVVIKVLKDGVLNEETEMSSRTRICKQGVESWSGGARV